MTPQPAPTPPAAPSPGPGTPGTAETGTGPHEASFTAAFRRYQAGAPLPYREFHDRAFATIAALEGECAALGDALAAVTHDFVPDHVPGRCFCRTDDYDFCWAPPDSPVHRTPARVRAELEEE